MTHRILIFYGSYRSDRVGIRLANYLVGKFTDRGAEVELIDAKAVDLPMLDRMYKEYAPGEAPPAMAELAAKIADADAFVFVVGEYNRGPQPGLKNLTDHFLEQWYWRPAAIASYSPKREGAARSSSVWQSILGEMGMVVVSSTLVVGQVAATLDAEGRTIGEGGAFLDKRFPRFADDLAWWTDAAKAQRAKQKPPY